MILFNNLKTSPEFGKETFVEDVDAIQPGLHTLHEEMKVYLKGENLTIVGYYESEYGRKC